VSFFVSNNALTWLGLLLGFLLYPIIMFFLLAQRHSGLNYINDLSSFNKIVVFISCALIFLIPTWNERCLIDSEGKSPHWYQRYFVPLIYFIIGTIFTGMFFILIIR